MPQLLSQIELTLGLGTYRDIRFRFLHKGEYSSGCCSTECRISASKVLSLYYIASNGIRRQKNYLQSCFRVQCAPYHKSEEDAKKHERERLRLNPLQKPFAVAKQLG